MVKRREMKIDTALEMLMIKILPASTDTTGYISVKPFTLDLCMLCPPASHKRLEIYLYLKTVGRMCSVMSKMVHISQKNSAISRSRESIFVQGHILLMRMSMRPNSFSVSSTAAVMLSGCLTSKHKGRQRRPDTADSFLAA